MKSSLDAEQFINVLLDRIERNDASARKSFQKFIRERDDHARTKAVLGVSQEGNRRHYRDMKSVEAKLAEWEQYGANLRAIIDSLDPHAKKRKTPVPPTPKPLETEIPF